MLLTVKDLAIISLIITVIVLILLYRLLHNREKVSPVNYEAEKKKTKNSRVIQFLEEEGYKFLRNIPELQLDYTVADKENNLVTGKNIAVLKKDGKLYLLKLRTKSMEGKRYNSPDIRVPLLEMQSSYKCNGIILFDQNKDSYQIYNFTKETNTKYLYMILVFLITLIGFMSIIILKLSGTI